MNLYSVRDIKADAFASPFGMANDAVATRAASGAASDPSTLLHKHPEDYQLWNLGHFDEQTGEINSNPQLVCNITSLIHKE